VTISNLPTGSLVIRTRGQGPYFDAKWRYNGKQVMRRIGPAWLVPDQDGGWKKKRGRPEDGFYTAKTATVRMAELIREHSEEVGISRLKKNATFAEAAEDWLDHLVHTARLKPSTLTDYRLMLARPGEQRKDGNGTKKARIMRRFGKRKLRSITKGDISKFLVDLDRKGLSARLVNKHRSVLHAIFNFCLDSEDYKLTTNPVSAVKKRREDDQLDKDPFTTEELLAIVRAAESGEHRVKPDKKYGPATHAEWERFNRQDAALFITAAETGMRQGELRALKWRDVDFDKGTIQVRRSMSGNEISDPKSRRSRTVHMDPASFTAQRLSEMSIRDRFTGKNDFVFCGLGGDVLDRRALSRRFEQAQEAAGVEYRNFHMLRHTHLSILMAQGFDSRTVQELAGHSDLRTTERYLHYREQKERGRLIANAFKPDTIESGKEYQHSSSES
jgi:integrase